MSMSISLPRNPKNREIISIQRSGQRDEYGIECKCAFATALVRGETAIKNAQDIFFTHTMGFRYDV
jgi:hypothetical protein